MRISRPVLSQSMFLESLNYCNILFLISAEIGCLRTGFGVNRRLLLEQFLEEVWLQRKSGLLIYLSISL